MSIESEQIENNKNGSVDNLPENKNPFNFKRVKDHLANILNRLKSPNRINISLINKYIAESERFKKIPNNSELANNSLRASYQSDMQKSLNQLAKNGLNVSQIDSLISRGLPSSQILKEMKKTIKK
ncbi:MAG: hypothetical protein QM532_00585 [Cyanobium sp. MAG06]|nr:hypothetical protein [Cyanobium sp. MAG06]